MTQREEFEAHWHNVRGKKAATRELARHPSQPQTYIQDSANRHWVTWQAAQAAQPAQDGNEVFQALIDPENQPNQYGIEFGMRGPKMYFKVGYQSFTLDYEPDEPGEFDFMKRMLCHAMIAAAPEPKP